MIIYPPFIADTIPAFTSDKIIIPFQQNPAVSIKEVTSFGLVVKDYLSSNIVANLTAAADTLHLNYNSDTKSGEVTFDIVKWKEDEITRINADEKITDKQTAIDKVNKFPETKQYYKFQMSYSDDGTYNAYSSTSIGRCINTASKIEIRDLVEDKFNPNTVFYQGVYDTDLISEPIYSYRFIIKNYNTNEVLQDSGDIKYNVDLDIIENKKRTSYLNFKLKYELNKEDIYEIYFTVTTINNYTISSPIYYIVKAGELPNLFSGNLFATQNKKAKSNGYVKILLQGENVIEGKGNFVLERTSDSKVWDELTSFSLTETSNLNLFTWKDYSIEQGIKYIYAIRQYSIDSKGKKTYSERLKSNEIKTDFEDMFLSDGIKQIKIKFNPKVSSFKNTILEQKTDTIGSQYPFFFRNGQIKYKEIPISGLISYLMDEEQLFMTNEELELIENNGIRKETAVATTSFEDFNLRTTELKSYNYTAERKFKLSVLDWLTNGQLKLFRSPAEGNYIIRLMNTSFSPNDSLGRLIHSFTATGYEAMDNTMDNLISSNLIQFPEIKEKEEIAKERKNLNDLIDNNSLIYENDGIEQIIWHTHIPGSNYIKLNNQIYYNTTGIFTTPIGIEFSSIEISDKNMLLTDQISFLYTISKNPETENDEDIFSNMINNSEDILFSVPSGSTLDDILEKEDGSGVKKIYAIYTLIVHRDMSYISNNSNDFNITIDGNIINCSDGQLRYYYNINPDSIENIGSGLQLDIYGRIETGASSKLGNFILGISRLGLGG